VYFGCAGRVGVGNPKGDAVIALQSTPTEASGIAIALGIVICAFGCLGDLIFEQVNAVYRPRGFLGVADVHRVESLVKSTLQVQRMEGARKEEGGEIE
jgi:hypothetical protein